MTRKARASFIVWAGCASITLLLFVLFQPGRDLVQHAVNLLVPVFGLNSLVGFMAVLLIIIIVLRLIARRMLGG